MNYCLLFKLFKREIRCRCFIKKKQKTRSGHSSTEGKSNRWRIRKPLTREIDFCFISAFQNSLSLSLMKLDVNINLERLYLSFLESYFYGQQFHFVFHSIELSLPLFARHFGWTFLSSVTSMFDFHFKPFWAEKPVEILNEFKWKMRLIPPPFLFLNCGKARCTSHSFPFYSLSDDWHHSVSLRELVWSVLHTRRCWRTFEDDFAVFKVRATRCCYVCFNQSYCNWTLKRGNLLLWTRALAVR